MQNATDHDAHNEIFASLCFVAHRLPIAAPAQLQDLVHKVPLAVAFGDRPENAPLNDHRHDNKGAGQQRDHDRSAVCKE
jgi:hypothetical protein